MIEDWIIETLNTTIKYTNNPEEIHICCPICGETRYRLYINVYSGVCYCHNCQFKGSNVRLIQTVENITYSKALERYKEYKGQVIIPDNFKEIVEEKLIYPDIKNIPKRSIALPEGFQLLIQSDNFMSRKAKNYLYTRGITTEQISQYKFGICYTGEYKNKIIIPIYENDQLKFWIARHIGKSKIGKESVPQTSSYQWSKSEVLFNVDKAINKYNSVVLSEGIFDALSWGEIGVAMLGKVLYPEQLNLLINYKRFLTEGVYIAVDADATSSAIKIANLLKSYFRVFLIQIPPEYDDPNYYYITHSRKDMWKLIKLAIEYTDLVEIKLRLGEPV